jgi:hypothetical protein
MNNSRRRQYSLKEDLSSLRAFILITFWLSSPIWFGLLRALPPQILRPARGRQGPRRAAPLHRLQRNPARGEPAAPRRVLPPRRGGGAVLRLRRPAGPDAGLLRGQEGGAGRAGRGVGRRPRRAQAAPRARGGGCARGRGGARGRGEAVQGRRRLGQTNAVVVQGHGGGSKAAGRDAVRRVRVAELGVGHCACLDAVFLTVYLVLFCFAYFIWGQRLYWIICSKRETGALTARLTFMAVSTLSAFALVVVLLVANDAKEATEFSMELAASEGLGNATASETLLSPAFGLKLRVKNARVLQPWCCDNGGEVVVSYSDAALTWGRVPPFCVQRRAPTELTLVPWGRGVGLTEDVRQRLASELRVPFR